MKIARNSLLQLSILSGKSKTEMKHTDSIDCMQDYRYPRRNNNTIHLTEMD